MGRSCEVIECGHFILADGEKNDTKQVDAQNLNESNSHLMSYIIMNRKGIDLQ